MTSGPRPVRAKSQLFHYFPGGKGQLLLAVDEEQARRVLDDQRPLLDRLTTWEAWEQWEELILREYPADVEHCPQASLTSRSATTRGSGT
jgi:hypothetical protein